jgi:hypothetical protein
MRTVRRVECSVEIALSDNTVQDWCNDRSDLYGPRETVPMTKRKRLLSYVCRARTAFD